MRGRCEADEKEEKRRRRRSERFATREAGLFVLRQWLTGGGLLLLLLCTVFCFLLRCNDIPFTGGDCSCGFLFELSSVVRNRVGDERPVLL